MDEQNTQTRKRARIRTEVNFNKLPFTCEWIFESDIVLSFSVLTVPENTNSSYQHVFFMYSSKMYFCYVLAELMERLYSMVVLLFTFYVRVVKS